VTSSMKQRGAHEPLYDIHPLTGISIEVFYANRTLEAFGRCGAGWFWWSRQRGCSPEGPASGPFPTCYSAYRNALGANLGARASTLAQTSSNSMC
jgi:hypothetical protein